MKSEPAEGAGIDRVLHLLETTDSERGGLLRRLLGDDSAESAPWHVGTAPGHLHLSRDAHWMFDRGLWTITPGFAISVAEEIFTEWGPEVAWLRQPNHESMNVHGHLTAHPNKCEAANLVTICDGLAEFIPGLIRDDFTRRLAVARGT